MFLRIIHHFVIALFTVLILTQCAQIVPLTGGQRDTEPPKIISMSPNNFTKNFTQKKIIFTFNEKIQLINPHSNILLIPSVSKNIRWSVKNKTLEILLPDTLHPNTTYKIIFNKTIADLTEKNTIDYFEYVFSTKNYIDSLYIKGNIKNQFSLNNEKNVLVALYDSASNDSAILKYPPTYFTRTDEQGNYIIKNLSNQSFKIFAYTDNNGNLNYDPFKEKIGLFKNPVNPAKDSIINFFIAEEKPPKNFLKKYYFHNSYQINLLYSYPDSYHILNSSKNIYLLNDSLPTDTCKIFFHNLDTLYLIVQNSNNIDTLKLPAIEKKRKQKFLYKLENQHNEKQPFFQNIILSSNFWIDSSEIKNKIILYENEDSTKNISINHISIFPNKIIILHALEQNHSYTLQLPVKSINSKDSTYFQKITFKTNSSENYAQLKINILFPDKKNYIVALYNVQNKIMYSKKIQLPIAASNQQLIEFKNVIPDTYTLKLIQDNNQNNQWDTHYYLLHSQKRQLAEKIFLYPQPIKLINNWDVVLDWKEVK